MLNEVMLVGVVSKIREFDTYKNELIVKIERSFKDRDNRCFDTLRCRYWKNLYQSKIENLKDGDIVSIKGRIESEEEEMIIMIEKIVLLNKSRNNILKTV
jgi:single-stranded DNA-binding protein